MIGMTRSLGDRSRYLSANDAGATPQGGLGLEISYSVEGVMIVGVVPDGPAAAAGIVRGDRLIRIDNWDVRGPSLMAVVGLLHGAVDSSVTVTVERAAMRELSHLVLRRAVVVAPTFLAQELNDRIAYVRIDQFMDSTPSDLLAAMRTFTRTGVAPLRGVILDLRSESARPRKYWSDLKAKLRKEGSEVSEKIGQLKMRSGDGKERETDAADVQTLLRLVQSIPSPKAEPFKQWLAKVGYERMQEIADPAQSLDRARDNWQKLGCSEKWIQQRMTGQETRNKLTDSRKKFGKTHGVEGADEFALLTNVIHQEWTGLAVKEHKALKALKTQNLRDHTSEAELIFTALAELSSRQIAERQVAQGLQENAKAGVAGGRVAKRAKDDLEKQTGQKVVSKSNFLPPPKVKKIT